MNKQRRTVLAKTMSVGAVTAVVLPSQWSKPVINSVLLPVHAQTTQVTPDPELPDPELPEPELSCPELVTQATFGPNSGGAAAGTCRVTITLLSSDVDIPVTIIAVDSDVAAPDTVTTSGLGEATDTAGPAVIWNGLAPGANFCQDVNTATGAPTTNVVFTVTYSCGSAPGEQFTQEFTLLDALEEADFGNV